MFTTLGVDGVQENGTEYRRTGWSTGKHNGVQENRTTYGRTGRSTGEQDGVQESRI